MRSLTETIAIPSQLHDWLPTCGMREDWPDQMSQCDSAATHYVVFHHCHVLLTCEPCFASWLQKAQAFSKGSLFRRWSWQCVTCRNLFDLRTVQLEAI